MTDLFDSPETPVAKKKKITAKSCDACARSCAPGFAAYGPTPQRPFCLYLCALCLAAAREIGFDVPVDDVVEALKVRRTK